MGGYICGMSHVTPRGRKALERKWKQYIERNSNRGDNNVMSRLQQGKRVVQEYNESIQDPSNTVDPEYLIQFVYTIESNTLGKLPTVDQQNEEDTSNIDQSLHSNCSSVATNAIQDEDEGVLV